MASSTSIDFTEKEKKQYIVVKIGEEQYGIDISFIDNIVKMCKITRVPKVQEYFKGIINLRGEIVPVMSIRTKMGLENDEYSKTTRIIILKLEAGMIGIVVDAVKEVVALSEEEIDRTAQSSKSNASFINGIGKNGEELISLLELSAVVDPSVLA